MSLKFTGREIQLANIENLVKAKQGAVFAVSGNAGMGKSILLQKINEFF
jgi:ABC-type transporter Mla maintaining outer membrane lipid asymmetry ATPase subunit MlaF